MQPPSLDAMIYAFSFFLCCEGVVLLVGVALVIRDWNK